MVHSRSQTKVAENTDLLALLADLKEGQEDMRKSQEEMKNQIQAHVEIQVGEIKDCKDSNHLLLCHRGIYEFEPIICKWSLWQHIVIPY
ncbi:hypothetical protein AVEN_57543-1 [Araneus ventricosus]|uniref:Uncharacterized protein n=1 Tax=Araneus ventricosus TaxID=182803 RepID=A0A4Y2TL13_ARAVE|nr:hypothetical protein AVEN_57543-1 [Araneus ventricosus]